MSSDLAAAIRLICALGTLPLIALPTFAHAQTGSASGPWNDRGLASEVTEAASRFMAANDIPGAAISVGQGNAQWVLTTGAANLATHTPVQPGTNFGYRSVTKSFTATAILQLAGQGLLSLGDPVSKYVAGVPNGNAITLQDLLDMRSGLYNYSASPALHRALIADPSHSWTPQELLNYAFAEPLQFTPGSSYEYSNTNTLVLGEVIERVTGRSWSQQIARSLTGPLGLTSVQYPGAASLPAPSAVGYVYDGDTGTYEPLDMFNTTGLGAAGGLTGTITDLANWGRVLGSGGALSEAEYVARIKSFGSTASDPKSPEYDSYGMGIGEIDGWIGHTGDGLGYESLVLTDPLTDRTIAILFNASNSDPDAPAHFFSQLLALLGWKMPPQTQVVADGTNATIGTGTVWRGLVSGPFVARSPIYVDHGGTASADGPVEIAPIGLYVPAITVTNGGHVTIDRGGTITASLGGDGADVYGNGQTTTLSLKGVAFHLQGDAVTGTGIDVEGDGVATLNDVQMTGSALAALHAGGIQPAAISGAGLDISLNEGHGAWATDGGTIVLSDSRITLLGSGYGLYTSSAIAPATIEGSELTVMTLAASGFGVLAEGPGAAIALDHSSVTTYGAGAASIALQNGATARVTDSTFVAYGPDAPAIAILAPLSGGATARSATLDLARSTLSAADGIAIRAVGAASISASASRITGAVLAADNAALTLALNEGSVWSIPSAATAPGSALTALLAQDSLVAFAPPPSSGAPFQRLVVHDYSGTDATIALNAKLGGQGMGADRLVIDGGIARGSTRFLVRVMGGAGLTTGDGIMLVGTENGGETEPGAFSLADRVASGAYDYHLARGSGDGTEDWFLRSSLPNDPALPDLRTEVPLDLTLPALAGRYGLAALGTYDARQTARLADGSANDAFWARAFGETGGSGSSEGDPAAQLQRFMRDGPAYGFGLSGAELGVDLLNWSGTSGARDVAGFYLGGGTASASVDGVYGGTAGNATLDAFSAGAYWTHFSPTGWYLDATMQGTFYAPVSSASSERQGFTTDGWGFIAALDAGKVFDLGARWSVEPEARLIFQHVALSGGADSYARIDFPGMNTGYGALDTRFNRSWQVGAGHSLSSWVKAGVVQAVGDGPRATFADLAGQDPLAFSAAPSGTSAEAAIGLASRLTNDALLEVRFQYVRHLGSQYGETFGGAANIQVRF